MLLIVVLLGGAFIWNFSREKLDSKVPKVIEKTSNTSTINLQKKTQQYIFIPYWSFNKSIVANSDHSLIYFGIGVNNDGIELEDQGYEKLKPFISLTPNAKERILAIRMTDKNINANVIKSLTLQENIASQAVSLALENNFDGVLLDYETSAFAFDSTTNKITSFYKLFAEKVKEKELLFYVTLYGDTYYRARAFDVKKIGELSDKVLIMTYDFSKSRGNPGPNFPLSDNGIYGYDLKKMVADYQKDVDNKKLVITFGYFGYDWRVDKKDVAVASGIPMSTNEINQEFIRDCKYVFCKLDREKETQEPSINYTDDSGEDHIIWFEDTLSVNKKKEFLKSKGILETGDWAYSYY